MQKIKNIAIIAKGTKYLISTYQILNIVKLVCFVSISLKNFLSTKYPKNIQVINAPNGIIIEDVTKSIQSKAFLLKNVNCAP